jgi:hypothetical protein
MPGLAARRPVSRIVLVACFVLATTLRLSFVDWRQLSVDEAESSINALTILEHGYPTDRYRPAVVTRNSVLVATIAVTADDQ